ncbi:MAG: GNAT family N-acetyltransferase [Thermoanaerobaculia bacterium]|nr:GNAT family N-acetyltransferase [Thermoanaerobaculia bacterium]
MNVRIERLTTADASIVFDWVVRLLRELGEEEKELGELAHARVLDAWSRRADQFYVLAAKRDDGQILGVLTLSVTFAIYANGEYGVIDEMYVDPRFRSAGIGARLVEEAVDIGRGLGWTRIDVTAPESERWSRTRRFYESIGFEFTGPKLRKRL